MKLENVTKNIRGAGLTVKEWAVNNGFKPYTVRAVIGGFTGVRRIGITSDILSALRRDGFLDSSS